MASNPSLDKSPDLDDWLSIDGQGRVRIRTGKVDIGQRISTALAMIAAEELDIDYARIDVAPVETSVSPDEAITSGSNSMQQSGNAIRLAAATARRHLLGRAAAALGVDIASLEVTDGLIRSRGTNLSVSYAELLDGEPFGIAVDPEAEVKSPAGYRVVGRARVARGMADLVTGAAAFIHDMTLPGMAHARVVRPPHSQARLRSLDAAAVARLDADGIATVRDGSFLAVAGADEYAVIKAIGRLDAAADWDGGAGLDARDIFAALRGNERISLPVVEGTPVAAPVPPRPASFTHQARYERPYHMHATIGPSAAMARFADGRLTLWTQSQGIYILRESMASALDMKIDDIHIHHAPGAGCYGHNGADDAAFDAALIARAMPGTPVLLKWTRANEHAWEPYGSCMAMDLCASLDEAGAVTAWSHETYSDTHLNRPRPGPGGMGPGRLLASRFRAAPRLPPVVAPNMTRHAGLHRNLDPLYRFPNPRLVKNLVRGLPLRTSAMRTLGGYANVFAIESFMDELAEKAGIDPLEFRLRHLDDPRARAVLEAMAERLNATPLAAGHGRGIAVSQYTNSKTYAAVGIEISVGDDARIRLHRAVVAADAGQVVDPDGLAAQMEGGVLQAASWTLYEEVAFERDGVTSRDWDSYPILRFSNAPTIEVILIDRPNEPFLGAGEASSGPTAGAIANAVRRATGLRLRRLPFTPEALRRAAAA